MTEENKIICNGVDVSKCKFLWNKKYCNAHLCIMGTSDNMCKNFQDCLYRQYEQKKLECEELQQKLDDTKREIIYMLNGCCPLDDCNYLEGNEVPCTICSLKNDCLFDRLKKILKRIEDMDKSKISDKIHREKVNKDDFNNKINKSSIGSNFDDFLKEENILEECEKEVKKRIEE